MKRNILNTSLAIVSMFMALIGCKQEVAESVQANEQDFYYTFALESPETRSILANDEKGKYGDWEEGDKLGTCVNSENVGYSSIVPGSPVTFKIYRSGGLKEGDVVYAYYPYNNITTSLEEASFEIPVSQKQNGETFDFDAMPMVSEGFEVPADLASETSQTAVSGQISLVNLGSVIDFQVYSSNIAYAEETVLSVDFTANKAIAGAFSKNVKTVAFNDESTLAISGFSETKISTTLDNAPELGTARSDAAHIYMVVAPSTSVTGSVIVTTNKAKYTFNLSTAQTFKRAGLKSFGLNLGACSNRIEEETGVPVIVSKTVSEILSEMGQSEIPSGTTVKTLTVDQVVTMKTTGSTNNGKVYGSYPSQDWRIYAQGNGDVIISVAKGYELQSVKLTYTKNNKPTFDGPTSGNEAAVSGSSVTYNVTSAGNILITAVEVKYVASTAVTYDFETVAKLNELATSTSTDLSGKLTNAIVSFVPGENDAIIKDATGSILLHKEGHGLRQGQTFTGNVEVSLQLYNGCSELTKCNADFTGDETEVAPAAMTLETLVGNLSTYQNAYVKVEELEVTAVNSKNVTVKNGTNSYVVYTSYGNASCVVGDFLTVTGTIAHFGTNDQIKVWSEDDIKVTAHITPSYTITIVSPTEAGCGIAATVDGEAISSGAKVESGKTVNLTATVGTGFKFNGWTVSGATVADASATTTSFVVGTTDVSISASFSGGNTDILNQELTGVTGNTYTAWKDVQSNTDAVYAGQSAGSNSSIQLRSQSPSGLVTTASGGYATKVTVLWESHTAANRVLNVYGKNTAYNSSADLYGDEAGILIGTIVKGTSELVIPYDCQFIGLRSEDGAMYLSEIRIEWSATASGNPLPTPTYNVNIADNIPNGTVTANKTTSIEAGESITLTVNPNPNYKLQSLTVDGSDVTESVDSEGKYTFIMPSHNVDVEATFTSTQGGGGTAQFEPDDFSSQGTSGTGSSISATKSGVTFSCNKGYGTTQIRCYSGGKITIDAGNKTITSISFTFSGSYTGGLETSYSNVNSSSWEETLSSQARITEVTVNYN